MKDKLIGINSFESKNFIFRGLHEGDKYDVYRLFSDENVMKLDESNPVQSIEEVADYINKVTELNLSPQYMIWGVELKQTNEIIATCGFKNWNRHNQHAEIGGNLSSQFWGKGYAKECLIALLNFAFHEMQLNKIYGQTNWKNKPAIKLMSKFGFQQEGILREHQLLDDKYEDVLLFALLKRDYMD
ncbi:GNAT family protein [Evansella sp. AB-P1]|uniref:GNAT family N-acetyltransferase n=1 Tax=Evansella sp. AB-P1 TaxID=3037653 RepID=UPI00241E64A8|nr:GNAT family protein [Evansella sp. AB-P1]MDG5789764.1 GNAT family protein [Evansella sp. AB-P1]